MSMKWLDDYFNKFRSMGNMTKNNENNLDGEVNGCNSRDYSALSQERFAADCDKSKLNATHQKSYEMPNIPRYRIGVGAILRSSNLFFAGERFYNPKRRRNGLILPENEEANDCLASTSSNEALNIENDGSPNLGENIQMPQGGLNIGEELIDAVKRELYEETGVESHLVRIVGVTQGWLSYTFPEAISNDVFKGRFIGQRQKWFLIDFLGSDEDISIIPKDPKYKREFKNWGWFSSQEIVRRVAPFKKNLYTKLFKYFNL